MTTCWCRVWGSPYAIGYFGYAYAAENADTIHPLNIEGIEPTFDAVEGGEYPLARPLFITVMRPS
ncbi:MAG: hypothetical protein R3C44_13140 [Chloroflexota bacterium]